MKVNRVASKAINKYELENFGSEPTNIEAYHNGEVSATLFPTCLFKK